jgi:GNAT superfamily N-acetyltransferase
MEWLRMRLALWPDADAQAHLADMDIWLSRPDTIVLVAPLAPDLARPNDPPGLSEPGRRGEPVGRLAGFVEVGTRSVAESCESSPFAYLEGWYVDADARRRGIGTALVRAAEEWARAKGFREFASDAQLTNAASHLAHAALGFIEVERLVAYRKVL